MLTRHTIKENNKGHLLTTAAVSIFIASTGLAGLTAVQAGETEGREHQGSEQFRNPGNYSEGEGDYLGYGGRQGMHRSEDGDYGRHSGRYGDNGRRHRSDDRDYGDYGGRHGMHRPEDGDYGRHSGHYGDNGRRHRSEDGGY